MTTTSTIKAHEALLRQAMLAGDVAGLDALLADELLFTDQRGQLLTKQADLEAHRSRTLVLAAITPSEQRILVLHPGQRWCRW